MVPAVRVVLAPGSVRAGALPAGLAAALAVPINRDCGARSVGVGMGSRNVAGETFDRAIPAVNVGAGVLTRAHWRRLSAYSAPFAGIAIPNSFITICKSFQVSFFWRGSRSRKAG